MDNFFGKMGAILALFLFMGLSLRPAYAATSGGTVVLVGIDGEDGYGGSGQHGPLSSYVTMVNKVLSQAPGGGSGILVIGGGKSTTDAVTRFWKDVSTQTGVAVTFVNGASNIRSRSFTGFKMIAVISDFVNTPSGGLTNLENDALIERQGAIAAFVNNGGSLLGFMNGGTSNPYQYIADVGAVQYAPAGGTATTLANVTGTAEGKLHGIDDTLDVCCWHDSYPSFPSFLRVLGNYPLISNKVSAIGGTPVIIPVLKTPDIFIQQTHANSFGKGQIGAAYTITVSNTATASTDESPVTITVTLPSDLTATAISGTGWNCTLATLTCTRTDLLAVSSSYPSITLTVDVATNATSPQTPSVTVAGGGDITPANNTAQDSTIIMDNPIAAAEFTPGTIAENNISTFKITLTNPNNAAVTGVGFTSSYPSGLKNAPSASGATTCGGTVTAANNGTSVALSGGTIPASGSCTVTVNVTSAVVGSYLSSTGAVTTTNAGTGIAATDTLTVTPAGVNLSGVVYKDSNHNGQLDFDESGTGLALFVKHIPSGTPGGPAVKAVSVNSSTGAYILDSVPIGSYILIVDDNNTLSDITPTLPAGWIGTDPRTLSKGSVIVGTIDLPNQHFGLFEGSRLSGTVIKDNGVGGGTANDGMKNGAEVGEAKVIVKALHNGCSGGVCDTTQSDGNGDYTLYIPKAASGTVSIVANHSNVPTGGSAGTTGGTYTRNPSTVTYLETAGNNYTGVNFAYVPENIFDTEGKQAGLAGTALFFPHTFIAGSAGSIAASVIQIPMPDLKNWSSTIYHDTDCDTRVNASEPVLPLFLAVTADQSVCMIVKVVSPSGAPADAMNRVTTTVQWTYANASLTLETTHTRTDIAQVKTSTGAGLYLLKTVDKTDVNPGDLLTYTLVYRNLGTQGLSDLEIHDTTPAFSGFFSAGCHSPLPVTLTGCTLITQPAVGGTGALVWILNGMLAPGSSGSVTYTVKIQN